jgi:histidyl-tRNA synthetase
MNAYNPTPVVGGISGFTNFNEAQHYAYAQWLATVKNAFELYGFTPFIPRPVELRDNLHFKGGVGKQIYAMARLDESGAIAADGRPAVVATDIGLPFDRTVPLALWVAQYANEMTLPYKRYDISWVFRGETAQAGRFRGFHQADVDIIGRNLDVAADAECLLAIADALNRLQVGSFVMHMNHIVIAKMMLERSGVPAEHEAAAMRIIDKLEKIGVAKVSAELQVLVPGMDATKLANLMAVCQFRGDVEGLKNILMQKGFATAEDIPESASLMQLTQLEQIMRMRHFAGARLVINPGMVRGLDYYTGIVVETFLEGKESFGSIASGGRYSNLVSGFAGKHEDIEGVGFSIGITRLFDVLCRANLVSLERKTTAQILLAYHTACFAQAFALAAQLRAQGCKVDLYANPTRQMKHQLEYAAKKGIPFVLMLMSADAATTVDEFVLKNMATRDQVAWKTLDDAVAHVPVRLVGF